MAVHSNLYVNGTHIQQVYMNRQDMYRVENNGQVVFEVTQDELENYSRYTTLTDAYSPTPDDRGYANSSGREYLRDSGDVGLDANMYSGVLLDLQDDVLLDIPVEVNISGNAYLCTSMDEKSIIRTEDNPVPPSWYFKQGTLITVDFEILVPQTYSDALHIIDAADWRGYTPKQKWMIFLSQADPTKITFNYYLGSGSSFNITTYNYTGNGHVEVEWRTSTNTIWINGEDTGHTPTSEIDDYKIAGKVGSFTLYEAWAEVSSAVAVYNFTINGETYDFDSPTNLGKKIITGSGGTNMELVAENGYWGDMWHNANTSKEYIVYLDGSTTNHIQELPKVNLGNFKRFRNILLGHVAVLKEGVQMSQADLDLLDIDPNLLPRLALGDTHTGLSVTPADLKAYYPLSDNHTSSNSPERCLDIVGNHTASIENYELSVRKWMQPYSWQTLRFDKDDAGIPTSFIENWGIKNNRRLVGAREVMGAVDTGIHIVPSKNYAFFLNFDNFDGALETKYITILDSRNVYIYYDYRNSNFEFTFDGSHFLVISKTEFPFPDVPRIAFGVVYNKDTGILEFVKQDGTFTQLYNDVTGADNRNTTLVLGASTSGSRDREPFPHKIGETMFTTKVDIDFNEAWQKYWERIKEVDGIVPVMTSNTSPLGEIVADSQYSALYQAWHSFDRVVDFANRKYWASADTAFPHFLGYLGDKSKVLHSIKLISTTHPYGNRTPNDFILQGSNDGTTWDDIQTYLETGWVPEEVRTLAVNTTTAYTSFRLLINSTEGMPDNIAEFEEVQFYGRSL